MACKNCGGSSNGLCRSCNGPKKNSGGDDCIPCSDTWIQKVDKKPDPFNVDINHIYQTPDNKLYVLSYDRTKMVEIVTR